MGRPQLFPEIFKSELRPIWWATGTEQPSPKSSAAGGQRPTELFLQMKTLYQRNMTASRILDIMICICLNSSVGCRPTVAENVGEGCSVPAAHQISRSSLLIISGNSWGLPTTY